MSHGYGLSVTPLQLAHAYATIGAHGLVRPVSFLRVDSPPVGQRVLDDHACRELIGMLESVVVAEGATGKRAAIPGYRVSGKTGTAWKATAGGYSTDRYMAVFGGVAPVTNPRLAAVVVIDEPQGTQHQGGTVSAPVFSQIVGGALRLLARRARSTRERSGGIAVDPDTFNRPHRGPPMTGVESQMGHPAVARSLADLTAGFVDVPAGIVVGDLTLDSRAVSPGSLFLACKGRTHHGLRFAEQAVARGARAVLFEGSPDERVPQLGSDIFVAAVPQLSQRAGIIADRFFGAPSQALTMAGITGTNGKTTCAWLLAQALQFCGRPAAYMGTLGFGRPPTVTATEHTTSDAVSVHRHLASLRSLGAECVSMEVSSHALDQDRVAGVRFKHGSVHEPHP